MVMVAAWASTRALAVIDRCSEGSRGEGCHVATKRAFGCYRRENSFSESGIRRPRILGREARGERCEAFNTLSSLSTPYLSTPTCASDSLPFPPCIRLSTPSPLHTSSFLCLLLGAHVRGGLLSNDGCLEPERGRDRMGA